MSLPTTTEQTIRDARLAREWLRTGAARDVRVRAGLSLAQAAAAVPVTREALWRWEAGQRTPRLAAAARYCALLREWMRPPGESPSNGGGR